MLQANGHNIIYILLVTFFTSLVFVPISKRIAAHIGALDYPNERKIHKVVMPRLGGLAVYASFLLGFMLFGDNSPQMLSVLIGSFVLMLMGIIDDVKGVPARYQFLSHIVAACIVVFYGKIYLTDISLFSLYFSFPRIVAYIISILFIVSLISAINLVDGLDGMSSGICIIYFITISIVAYLLGNFGGLEIILALIMIGSLLGFLVYNFPPASTFVGQCGSNFMGFMVAVTSLIGFKTTTLTSLIIPIIILALPIFDTAFSIFRRLLKGQGITEPDKEHFHHQLLKMRFSPRLSVLIVYMINILFAAVSIFYILGDDLSAMVIYILLMILLLFIVLKTDILFEHRKNKKEIEEPVIESKKEEVKQVSKPKKKIVNKTKRKK